MRDIGEAVRDSIRRIVDDFHRYPDKYLTEDDVRCMLVANLLKNDDLRNVSDTADGTKSIPVHSEVRWYGRSGRLKWRSDIVIINTRDLKTKNGVFKLPSKGYAFNMPESIIEIKLRRINGASNDCYYSKINADRQKLIEIKEEVSGDYPCFIIALDKKANITDMVNRVNGRNSIDIIYKYSREESTCPNN